MLIFLLPFLVLVAAGAAFVVAVDSVTDRHLTLPATDRILALIATVAFGLAMLAVKPRAWGILKKNGWKP